MPPQRMQLMDISMVQDGFVPAKVAARPRPAPRGATLGDFVSKNSFQALSGEHAKTTTTTTTTAARQRTTAAEVARRRPTTSTTAATTTRPVQAITRGTSADAQTKDPHDMGMLEFEQMLQLELANAERILQYEATEPAAVIPLPRSLVNSVTCVMTSEHGDLF